MARRDVAFFAVTFAVIFEPRPLPRWLPFHLWTDQVSLLAWYDECFGVRSLMVNKTRGIGLSWITVAHLFHAWLFKPEVAIAVLSADKTRLEGDDANSLIGKFQYLYDGLPAWAKVTPNGNPLLARKKENFSFINVATKAIVQGYISTNAKLRGFRFTVIFADEFAFYARTNQAEWLTAAGGTTHSMWMISTWNDYGDTFHNLFYENLEDEVLRIEAFWWNNYERWRGAYKVVNGIPVYVDKDYQHEPDYQFGRPDVLEPDFLRSPWVDSELSQPQVNILKTVRDLYGPVSPLSNCFFEKLVLDLAKQSTCDPDVEGTLQVGKGNKITILPTTKSNIRTWGLFKEDGKLRNRGPYVAFCDLSEGVGSAFSVLAVIDKSGEQVLEYGVNTVPKPAFAANVVAICRWLGQGDGDGAVLLDVEGNGPYKTFIDECLRLKYGHLWRSALKFQQTKRGEIDTYWGTVNRDGGAQNFEEIARAILTMEVVIKSTRAVNDMRLYSKSDGSGKVKEGHPIFPRGRKDGHGDFLHALAGAWWRARLDVSPELRNSVELEESQRLPLEKDYERFGEPNQLWGVTAR